MKMSTYKTVDDYISSFPKDIQAILEDIRRTIRKAAPEAQEKIAYQIPTFTYHGNLVHFAAFKDHISLFPGGSPIEKEVPEVAKYRTGKGTLQFPLDKPIPFELILKIVKYRIEERKIK